VTGIGPKRWARIVAGWAKQKVIQEIMLFLHNNGWAHHARSAFPSSGWEAVDEILAGGS
jgi:hypothetical protein